MALPNLGSRNRRRHPRWPVPDDGRHVVELWWPNRRGHRLTAPLHDLSPAGLSFRLEHDLPGIEVCSLLRTVSVRLGEIAIRADLVVIHLTARPGVGTVCGTLVYPKTDEDLVALKRWLATHPAA